MSTDKKNTENGAMEVEETSNDETSDTKPVVNTDDTEESLKSKDKDSKKKLKGKEVKKDSKAGNAKPAKEGKVGKVKDEDSKSEDDEDEEDEDDDDDDDDDDDEKSGDGKVPLLDQPLELSGTRERKKVTRFSEEYKTEPKDSTPIEIPEGSGSQLGNIPRIEANIQRSKPDALKPLHRILFNRAGKASTLRKSIRKFNGFDFDKDSDQYAKKKQVISKLDAKSVKEVCSILDLKKNQKRDELNETVLNFLLKPEDSGKGSGKPRPKRAARANNKTYSESDEEEERKSSRRGKKKRANLKEMSSDEEDEIEDDKDEKANKKDDNASDNDKKEKDVKENDSVDDAKENDSENEDDSKDGDKDEGSSDDSEETSSKSKKARSGKNNKKQSTKKPKAAPKKAEKKQLSKKKTKSGDESSEDEPLSKKSKAPPTDEEIKSYVKEILEGANLEETTMKIVCKQVYAHYPDFDLAHKKDFIKTTVKSLIST